MESADINWLAVVAAALVQVALGALWYSPLLFARPWMRAVGKTEDELSAGGAGYALATLMAFVTAIVLAHVVDWAGAEGLLSGLLVGVVMWLGFVWTVLTVNTWFGGRSRALWAIDSGYPLAALALMGAILAVWD